jgi:hypothetical protein
MLEEPREDLQIEQDFCSIMVLKNIFQVYARDKHSEIVLFLVMNFIAL